MFLWWSRGTVPDPDPSPSYFTTSNFVVSSNFRNFSSFLKFTFLFWEEVPNTENKFQSYPCGEVFDVGYGQITRTRLMSTGNSTFRWGSPAWSRTAWSCRPDCRSAWTGHRSYLPSQPSGMKIVRLYHFQGALELIYTSSPWGFLVVNTCLVGLELF